MFHLSLVFLSLFTHPAQANSSAKCPSGLTTAPDAAVIFSNTEFLCGAEKHLACYEKVSVAKVHSGTIVIWQVIVNDHHSSTEYTECKRLDWIDQKSWKEMDMKLGLHSKYVDLPERECENRGFINYFFKPNGSKSRFIKALSTFPNHKEICRGRENMLWLPPLMDSYLRKGRESSQLLKWVSQIKKAAP